MVWYLFSRARASARTSREFGLRLRFGRCITEVHWTSCTPLAQYEKTLADSGLQGFWFWYTDFLFEGDFYFVSEHLPDDSDKLADAMPKGIVVRPVFRPPLGFVVIPSNFRGERDMIWHIGLIN